MRTVCFLDDLPAANVSRLRALGVIKEGMSHVIVPFGEGEQKRLIGVAHMKFRNGGLWSFLRCPNCGRRARTLRLYGKRLMCRACCLRNGVRYRIAGGSPAERAEARALRIERLHKLLEGAPARLSPRPGRTLDRRTSLELSLRRALITARQDLLRESR